MNRIAILAALVAASSLTPALAQASAGDPVERVRVADLDLSREADVRRLDRRIRSAVEQVCGATSDADPAGRNEARRCRAETRARLAVQRQRAIASAGRPSRVALASER